VRTTDEAALPKSYCRIESRIPGVIWETVLAFLPEEFVRIIESSIEEVKPDSEAIKAAIARNEEVPGAQVHRGHSRSRNLALLRSLAALRGPLSDFRRIGSPFQTYKLDHHLFFVAAGSNRWAAF
jgi:hypothetical protein